MDRRLTPAPDRKEAATSASALRRMHGNSAMWQRPTCFSVEALRVDIDRKPQVGRQPELRDPLGQRALERAALRRPDQQPDTMPAPDARDRRCSGAIDLCPDPAERIRPPRHFAAEIEDLL